MKTILLTIFHGAAAKNILRTGVLNALLKEKDVRIVCLMRFPDRVLLYQQEIPHERLAYDAFYRIPGGALERMFSFLKFRLIKTATTDLRHKMSYDSHRNYSRYVSSLLFNWVIARKVVRQALRFVDYHLVGDSGFGSVLEKYRPDAVVVTNLFDDGETALLRESKRRGIVTVGYVNSWDKLTARSSVRLLPDKLIVFNQILKQEAVEHADMAEERVAACGIPQYDQYITDKPGSREKFFKENGLDAKKHLILYAPVGVTFSDSDWEVIDLLHEVISGGEIKDAELLVRFPPNDFLDEQEVKKRPWLKYDLPGVRFGTKRSEDWDMDFDELRRMTNLLANTSVVVGYSASIIVDAAVFDKPSVGVNFEVKKSSRLARSPIQRYKTDHFRKVLRARGIRLAGSRQELVDVINAYLRDPLLDREQRRRFVEEQCWRLDGKSGERVANVILEC
ncbi:MAG: CDP-glycerol glycerophosphotransferase family protein [Candidatus Sungbacteria bacterium]|nr:CDP-glycerol glycerophosphotransferase family protein [Candidatus Sungbacteria bacterium]